MLYVTQHVDTHTVAGVVYGFGFCLTGHWTCPHLTPGSWTSLLDTANSTAQLYCHCNCELCLCLWDSVENQYLQHLHIITVKLVRSDQTNQILFHEFTHLETWTLDTSCVGGYRWCNVLYLAWMQNSGTAEVKCKRHLHYIYATIDLLSTCSKACTQDRIIPEYLYLYLCESLEI